MSSDAPAQVSLREFRPGPVIGGVVAGLLGLVVAVLIAIFIERKIRRKRTTKKLKVEADDVESGLFSVSTCTYDDSDSDTLHSPTETSPALRSVREKLGKEEFDVSEKEVELVVEHGALPPPFPVYKDTSL